MTRRRPSMIAEQLAPRNASPILRLALTPGEAAASLGVSVPFLEEHVLLGLRAVHRGERRLIPVQELERWLERNAEPIEGQA